MNCQGDDDVLIVQIAIEKSEQFLPIIFYNSWRLFPNLAHCARPSWDWTFALPRLRIWGVILSCGTYILLTSSTVIQYLQLGTYLLTKLLNDDARFVSFHTLNKNQRQRSSKAGVKLSYRNLGVSNRN